MWDRILTWIARRLPPGVKGWLKAVRRAYVRRVWAFTPADLRIALLRLGLRPGDVVIVHSSFNSFLGFRGSPGDVIRTLQEIVGPDGALLMPTIPFGGSAIEYASRHPIFDARRTVSQMGLLTEVFRRSAGVQRSLHPTHSVAAWGGKAAPLIAAHHLARTPCGRDTPYGRLLATDGKILFLGVTLAAMTFFHALEEELEPRMPFHVFAEEEYVLHSRDETGEVVACSMRLFGLHLAGHRDMTPLVEELKSEKTWHATRVGRLKLILLGARDVRQAVTNLAERGVFCYEKGVERQPLQLRSAVPRADSHAGASPSRSA